MPTIKLTPKVSLEIKTYEKSTAVVVVCIVFYVNLIILIISFVEL